MQKLPAMIREPTRLSLPSLLVSKAGICDPVTMTGLPSPIPSVSYQGWNPGTLLTYAKILFTSFLTSAVPNPWDQDQQLMPFVPRVWTMASGPKFCRLNPTFRLPTAIPRVYGKNAECGSLPNHPAAQISTFARKGASLFSCRFLK